MRGMCNNLWKETAWLAHGQFSSVVHTGPRQAYDIDFYQVAKSLAGFQWILTVIDLFSREVMFLPMKTRQATELVREGPSVFCTS